MFRLYFIQYAPPTCAVSGRVEHRLQVLLAATEALVAVHNGVVLCHKLEEAAAAGVDATSGSRVRQTNLVVTQALVAHVNCLFRVAN